MSAENPLLNTTVTCKECGKLETLQWVPDLNRELADGSLCFKCHFWLKLLERDKTDPKCARIGGTHYVVGPADGFPRGFGGDTFYLRMPDGSLRRTRNLWCQGNIPDRFRERMPDNAAFLAADEFKAAGGQ